MPNRAKLVRGNAGIVLMKLTIPMIFGMLGTVTFNLADTFFVGQLGENELAALSFTFPIVMIIGSVALGLGLGASAIISKAIGEGDHHKVQRYTTDSLLLSLLVVIILSVIGFFTIRPLFGLLGAKDVVIDLIKQYMMIWYPCIICVVLPMVANNALRARGDTLIPGMLMTIASLLNIILDPILIFDKLHLAATTINLNYIIIKIPELSIPIHCFNLGVRGAAIATVFSRLLTLIISLLILINKYNMITFNIDSVKSILFSWKKIAYIGVPTALTRTIIPLVLAFMTWLLSNHGMEAVAAFGVSSRLEFFAMTPIFALATVIGPFTGQNWGAKKYNRVKNGTIISRLFSLVWGFIMTIIFGLFAKPIALIFNSNPLVIKTTITYLRIVPLGYGMQGILLISATVLNVLNKPIPTFLLIVIQMIFLCMPLSFLGSYFFDIDGIIIALLLVNIIGGLMGHLALSYYLNYLIKKSTILKTNKSN